jgi:hypothetical protein
MVVNSAQILRHRRKQQLENGQGRKKFVFSALQKLFFELFLLVSIAKFLEIYDKKRKSKILF